MRILGHKPTVTAWIGMAIIVVNLAVAIFGPVFAPYSESQTVGATWDEPSMQMLLGADQIGRDMLTRLIYGARVTIGVALATTALSFFIGITLGFAAAVLGGWVDTVISRLVDVILSIPLLILALIILGVFGSSIPVLIITIAVLDSTRVFRLSRALGMNLTVLEYVEAARLRGEGTWWIIRNPAQRLGAAAVRVRTSVLLQLPVHCCVVVSGARHTAAVCRLGRHGARELCRHQLRHAGADLARAGDHRPDGGGQYGRGLAVVGRSPPIRRAGRIVRTR